MPTDPGLEQLEDNQIDLDNTSATDALLDKGEQDVAAQGYKPVEFGDSDDEIPSGDDSGEPAGDVQQAAEGGEEPQAWDEGLLSQAGLTSEEATRHFRTQEELRAAMAWQDSQALQAGRAALQQQQLYQQWLAQQQQAQAYQQQRPTAVYQGQQAQPQPPEAFNLDLDPEEWGQETVDLLQKMHSFYNGKLSAAEQRALRLEQAFGGMHQTMLRQQQEAYLEAFDTRVNSLPEEYRESFGVGNRATLPPTGKEFQNRVRLNQAMQAIAHGRQVSGLAPLNHDQLFDRALKAEFSNISEQAVRRQVGEQVTKRLGQTTSRPSNRKGSNLSPEGKAAQRVATFAKKHGILVSDHEDIRDGL